MRNKIDAHPICFLSKGFSSIFMQDSGGNKGEQS